ncbi:MAG: DUF4139 domain-containing protein [Candidatus Micrarchaeota archaeon]|nr:DUF4139 domain-containing protein [Candidatus Micrarchaeota archaeon]
MKGILALAFVLMLAMAGFAFADATASGTESVELTVYQTQSQSSSYDYSYYSYSPTSQVARLTYEASNGVGLVKELRSASMKGGSEWLVCKDVAAHVLPTSVKVKDKNTNMWVLEQNYDFDLVSSTKLMEKYVGKTITVKTDNNETIEGTLLSYSDGLVLSTKEGIVSISAGIKEVHYPTLPEGLLTSPTLSWLVNTPLAGNHKVEISYLTSGISWEADYVGVVSADEKKVDLQGWVTVTNYAGKSFEDAKLKLVAGDIHFVTRGAKSVLPVASEMYSNGGYSQPQFAEEGLFEYHLYTLDRPTTIKDSQIKQITLFTSDGVSASKEYIFDGVMSGDVQVKVKFNNTQANGLGIPIPKGVVRIYKPDSSGQLQFLGEDNVDHTPKDEEVSLLIGNAFDIVGERNLDSQQSTTCSRTDTYKIKIKNHKSENVQITVVEHPYGDWGILEENYKHEKKSTTEVKWNVPVNANGEATLEYVIRTTWC